MKYRRPSHAIPDHPQRAALAGLLARSAGGRLEYRTIYAAVQAEAPGALCPANIATWGKALGWTWERSGLEHLTDAELAARAAARALAACSASPTWGTAPACVPLRACLAGALGRAIGVLLG